MIAAATRPREDPRTTRMLHVDVERGSVEDRCIGDLRTLLRPNDLLVLNDAATLPASLRGVTRDSAAVEARLAGEVVDGRWRAVLFGHGDFRTRTEDRAPPPLVRVGDRMSFGRLEARVVDVDERHPRLVVLDFEPRGEAFWRALYRAGQPIAYAHVAVPLSLWQVQTAYAGRPWAVEAPSAGFGLTWDLLLDLRRSGVGLASVTHAAGLSSTGDPTLDVRLPWAERYEVSERAVAAVQATRRAGGRVVAMGTTVARALEGAAASAGGRLVASRGTTDFLLGPSTVRQVVDDIVTGMHEVGTSHFSLLESFAPRALLEHAQRVAERRAYRGHEFGDLMWIAGGSAPRGRGRGPGPFLGATPRSPQ